MKKWMSVMLCLALLAGMVTIDTNAIASQEDIAGKLEVENGDFSVLMSETATVESGDFTTSISTPKPMATATATVVPTQAPVFTGNLTVDEKDVFVVTDGAEKDTCVITGYKGSTAATTIYVPAKLNDKTVTAVSGAVFADCYFLQNVVVKGDAEIQGSGTFHPEAKVEIWGKENGKAAAYATASGLVFHAIDGSAVSGKKGSNLRQATLNWAAVNGAVSYNIYRKRGKREYALYTNVTATTYTNSKLKLGATYTYKVAPVFTASNGETINGISGAEKKIALTPAKPQKVRAKGIRGGIQVRWKRNKSVTGYEVYMKVHVKGFKTGFNRVKIIKKSKITGYRCKMLVRGMKYSYGVRTYKKVNGKKVYSPFVTVTTKAK